MPIRFHCEGCDARMKVPDGSRGRRVRCPRCGRMQRVADKGQTPRDPAEDEGAVEALASMASPIESPEAPATKDEAAASSPPSLWQGEEAPDGVTGRDPGEADDNGSTEAGEGVSREVDVPQSEAPSPSPSRGEGSGPSDASTGPVVRPKGPATPPASIPLSRSAADESEPIAVVPAYDEREPQRMSPRAPVASARPPAADPSSDRGRDPVRPARPIASYPGSLPVCAWALRLCGAAVLVLTAAWIIRVWTGPAMMTLGVASLGLTLATMAWTLGELARWAARRH